MSTEHFSIRGAAARGIERLRLAYWLGPMDHIKIDILEDKTPGPWANLYSPMNIMMNGADPKPLLINTPFVGGYDQIVFDPYTGPLPDSDEYKAAVALFQKQAE